MICENLKSEISLCNSIFIAIVTDKLSVALVMKINSERSEVFIFHKAGPEEFIKDILRLYCFAQSLSFPCDIKNWKVWLLGKTHLQIGKNHMKIVA